MNKMLGRDIENDSPWGTELVEGLIKWFNPEKGYGFIVPKNGGEDILLYNDAVAGLNSQDLQPGTPLTCEIVKSVRGMMATRIVKILEHVSESAEKFPGLPSDRAHHVPLSDEEIDEDKLVLAIVKWFDERRGFGFAVTHDDEGDVMLSRQILRKFNIRMLFPGDKVRVFVEMTDRGRLARYVRVC